MIKIYCIETTDDIWMFDDYNVFITDVLRRLKIEPFLFKSFEYRIYTRLIDKKEWLAMPDEQDENDPS